MFFLHANFLFLLLSFSPQPPLFPTPQSIPPLFPFRKEQAFHGYKQSKAFRVVVYSVF